MDGLTPDELVTIYAPTPEVAPLVGLSSVDWSGVSDAYGPAVDIPALIKALLSEDADHREFAILLLHQTIWHQGNIYSATAPAIPFLYRLLESEGPHDKDAIASLLFQIADGKAPFSECANDPTKRAFWEPILASAGRTLDAEIVKGKSIESAVRRALILELNLLRAYLDDQSDAAWMVFVGRVRGLA